MQTNINVGQATPDNVSAETSYRCQKTAFALFQSINNKKGTRSLSGHCQAEPDLRRQQHRGFTLIELLVVVLIIGILAAVAVPQYKVAVTKSRYNALKPLVNSIVQAQEVYYLANGKYAVDFEELDISMPGGQLANSVKNYYYYDWGFCGLYDDGKNVSCRNNDIQMAYSYRGAHSELSPNERVCHFYIESTAPNLKTKPQYKVCIQETGHKNVDGGTSEQHFWIYP